MEKKVSNTRYILDATAKQRKKDIEDLLKAPKRYQNVVFNSNARTPYTTNMRYHATAISDNEDKVHVVTRQYIAMRGSSGNYFVKSGDPKMGFTYNKKGRASSRLTIWSRMPILHVIDSDEFQHLVDAVQPSAKALLKDRTVRRLATKGLIGSILAGNIVTADQAMKYRITYLLKRAVGLQKEDSLALYNYYQHFTDRLVAEGTLYNSLDPRAVVNLFAPLGDVIGRQNFIDSHKEYAQQLERRVQVTGDKIDWTGAGFKPEEFLDRISRKEKGIKDIVQLWGGGPVLSRNSRSVYSKTDNDLPF
jgi:hypothetical protein